MRPRIRIGLIVGVIGLVINMGVATVLGACGPLLTLIAGGLAGFLAARQEKMSVKAAGARLGAVAGAITGGLMLVGQMLGTMGALFLVQSSGTTPLFGTVPPPSADPSQQAVFYGTGLLMGLCFGGVGVALAALAGAGTGYLGTPSQPLSDLS